MELKATNITVTIEFFNFQFRCYLVILLTQHFSSCKSIWKSGGETHTELYNYAALYFVYQDLGGYTLLWLYLIINGVAQANHKSSKTRPPTNKTGVQYILKLSRNKSTQLCKNDGEKTFRDLKGRCVGEGTQIYLLPLPPPSHSFWAPNLYFISLF